MARRKSLIIQALEARAKNRLAQEREWLRQQRLAQQAAEKAAREAQRAQAAAARARREQAAREAKARAAAAIKAERDAARAVAEQERHHKAEQAEAARAAAARERARVVAQRSERQAASEARAAEVVHRNEALARDGAALEGILVERARGSVAAAMQTEAQFNRAGPDGLVDEVLTALAGSVYPSGLNGSVAGAYRPENRELILELELPRQDVVPKEASYRYVKTRDAIEAQPRKDADVRATYARLIARIVLRTLAEALDNTPVTLVSAVALNGYVSAKDRATGQPVRPCLISVAATRDEFEQILLDEPELDPQACLRQFLNAIVSPHPYDLEPVRPVIQFDLSRYKFIDEMNIVAGLDSRTDLLQLKPVEFEHLVRELFEAMGLKSWVTQGSRDDGVDAVAVNEDSIVGGLCVIQAKRYSRIVGLESINALAGVMNDKAAAKGVLVTTSWVGKASREFAARNGRMTIIEGRELRYLIKEHLGLDVLISLPTLPPDWTTADLG